MINQLLILISLSLYIVFSYKEVQRLIHKRGIKKKDIVVLVLLMILGFLSLFCCGYLMIKIIFYCANN